MDYWTRGAFKVDMTDWIDVIRKIFLVKLIKLLSLGMTNYFKLTLTVLD